MMKKNNKKVVLITGCSHGVGHAVALSFVNRGYITYATGRNVNELKIRIIVGRRDNSLIGIFKMNSFSLFTCIINTFLYGIRRSLSYYINSNFVPITFSNIFTNRR